MLFEKLNKLKEVSKTFESYEEVTIIGLKIKIGPLNAEEMGFLEAWALKKSKTSGSYLSWCNLGASILAIKTIDGIDLPGGPDELMDTGETDEDNNGNKVPVKKSRFDYLYSIFKTFDSEIMNAIMKKFTIVARKTRDQVKDMIKDKPEMPPEDKKIIHTDKRTIIKHDKEHEMDEQTNARKLSEKHTENPVQGVFDTEVSDQEYNIDSEIIE